MDVFVWILKASVNLTTRPTVKVINARLYNGSVGTCRRQTAICRRHIRGGKRTEDEGIIIIVVIIIELNTINNII